MFRYSWDERALSCILQYQHKERTLAIICREKDIRDGALSARIGLVGVVSRVKRIDRPVLRTIHPPNTGTIMSSICYKIENE